MKDYDANPAIEVSSARAGGLGIFATRDMPANTFIYAVHYEREVTKLQPLDPEAGESAEHCAYPNGKVMLVSSPARYVNHSCDPTAYYRYDDDLPQVYARRRLSKGDEITVDYLINNSGGDSWPCRCGSRRCRGETGTSFFELPLPFQREYYPLLADWFIARHPERIAKLQAKLEL